MSQLQKHSYQRFPASSISLASESFVNINFYGAENDELLRQEKSFKSLFNILFIRVPEKYFVKLYNICYLTKFQGISKFIPVSIQPSWPS